ncbi:MAG: UbiA family prenyltransferase [Bacteroidia bacterium]
MKIFLSAFRLLVFSNIYVSLCALTFTAKTSLLLYGNNGDWKVNILVFFATLFLYSFHRLYKRSKMLPEERAEARHTWADEHKVIYYSITFISFISAAVLMFSMPLRVWILLIPGGVLGLGYTLPIIPLKSGWKRLRDLSWLKAFWISLAYAWLTTFMPVVYHSGFRDIVKPDVLFVFIRSLIFVFVLVIPFDIRDLQHDYKNGIKSLPVLLGVSSAIRIARLLLLVFMILVLIQFQYYHLHINAASALCVSALEAFIIVPLSKPGRPDLFYPLAIETSMIFHWVVILAAISLS